MSVFDLISGISAAVRLRSSGYGTEAKQVSCEALVTDSGPVLAILESGETLYLQQALNALDASNVKFMLPDQFSGPSGVRFDCLLPFGSVLGWKTIVDTRVAAYPEWLVSTDSDELIVNTAEFLVYECAMVGPLTIRAANAEEPNPNLPITAGTVR